MKEQTLVIFLKDACYAERLMNYCNADKENGISAVAFSDEEACTQFLEAGGNFRVLCDVETKSLISKLYYPFSILTEEDATSSSLSKFSSAKYLLEKIFEGSEADTEGEHGEDAGITGFFGLFDDGASTRLAVEEARKAAAFNSPEKGEMGQKVLLVSASPYFCRACFMQEQGSMPCEKPYDALSRLFFALTGDEEQNLEAFVDKAPGFDVLYGITYLQDAEDVSLATAKKFAQLLNSSGYSRVFLDLTPLHGWSPALFACCDSIEYTDTGKGGRLRLDRYIQSLEFAGFPAVAARLKEVCL